MIWLSVKRGLKTWGLFSRQIKNCHLSPRSFFGGLRFYCCL